MTIHPNQSHIIGVISIPQGNHLVRVINQLIDHLKQTSIMEPPITACFNKKDGY